MIVWVQLPALKIHLYHKEILITLGNLIGRTIKLYYHTLNQQRAKFARIAVEVDMSKPLVPRIFLDDQWQKVEYENLPLVCFECGKIGHTGTQCPLRPRPTGDERALVVGDPLQTTRSAATAQEPQAGFGPWMLVTKKSRRNSRETQKKGKGDTDFGMNPQGSWAKNGKGGSKQKESEEVIHNQRSPTQERKGSNNAKKGGEDSRKGKGKMNVDIQETAKGLLGPRPSKSVGLSLGPRPTGEASSSTALVKALDSPGITNSVGPEPSGPKHLSDGNSGPTSMIPTQSVTGTNGTNMQILLLPSPAVSKTTSHKEPTAGLATKSKQNKISKNAHKRSSPLKVNPAKSLKIWTPVKDRKAKAKAGLATLTLQEISAWTEVASNTKEKNQVRSKDGVLPMEEVADPLLGAPSAEQPTHI
ncbi:unnamed protein product [Linum tenue]|nr:unnamed protein product [Linum tenue]